MGANAHHPAAAIGADLTIFVEEVDTMARPPVAASAVPQLPGHSLAAGQLRKQPIELVGVRLPPAAHERFSTTMPGG